MLFGDLIKIAKSLNLGDVLVRKDLAQICGKGKPKVGYVTKELLESLHSLLECKSGNAVIIGAGKIGKALLDYNGFEEFNIILWIFQKEVCITIAFNNLYSCIWNMFSSSIISKKLLDT